MLSADLAADAAQRCGEPAWAADARALAERVRVATWARWADHARTSQTGCAVALRLGLVPEDEREAVADALAELVRESEGRVRTGFLGTPLVLPALADAGRWDEAYLMLLRQEMPSWLYQVRQGATTVWERWDAIRPDGSIHPGTMTTPPEMAERAEGDEPHMLSFNHYAYGAVIDWVYRHVAAWHPTALGRATGMWSWRRGRSMASTMRARPSRAPTDAWPFAGRWTRRETSALRSSCPSGPARRSSPPATEARGWSSMGRPPQATSRSALAATSCRSAQRTSSAVASRPRQGRLGHSVTARAPGSGATAGHAGSAAAAR